MTVAPPPFAIQELLFEQVQSGSLSIGALRAHAGRIMEQIICRGMALVPGLQDSKYEVCFDALRRGVFFEIKSVRRYNKVPLYDWRLRKDAAAGKQLLYLFCEHNSRDNSCLQSLIVSLIHSLQNVYALTAEEIAAIAAGQPLCLIRQQAAAGINGYNRKGYKEGYRNVPLKTIRERACLKAQAFHGMIYGMEFNFWLWYSEAATHTINQLQWSTTTTTESNEHNNQS